MHPAPCTLLSCLGEPRVYPAPCTLLSCLGEPRVHPAPCTLLSCLGEPITPVAHPAPCTLHPSLCSLASLRLEPHGGKPPCTLYHVLCTLRSPASGSNLAVGSSTTGNTVPVPAMLAAKAKLARAEAAARALPIEQSVNLSIGWAPPAPGARPTLMLGTQAVTSPGPSHSLGSSSSLLDSTHVPCTHAPCTHVPCTHVSSAPRLHPRLCSLTGLWFEPHGGGKCRVALDGFDEDGSLMDGFSLQVSKYVST